MPRATSTMDVDSSPGILPPSSNPFTGSSQTRTPTRTGRTTAGQTRRTGNALSLGDEDDPVNAEEAMERDYENEDRDHRPQAEEAGAGAGARGRAKGPRARMNLDVPPVRDATGEKVMESFEQFLKS